MIINVKRKELLAEVKKVAKAAAASGSPVKELTGILLEADGQAGVLRLTATNLEVSIRSAIPANVETDGSAVINAKLLPAALDLLRGEEVYMELQENGQFRISGEKTRYTVPALPGKDYPKINIPYPGDTVSVKGFKSLITRSVLAASSPNPVRPALSSVKLAFSKSGVSAVSCDGYCAVHVTGDPECKGDLSILVPAASLKLFASIASDSDVCELGVAGSGGAAKNVVITDGATLFSARLVDGEPMNTDAVFQGIVPVAAVSVSADKLKNALGDVSSVAGANGKVEITIEGDRLALRCFGEQGKAVSMVEAGVINATEDEYLYSLKYLINCVKLLKGDLTMNFTQGKVLEIRNGGMRYIQLGLRADAGAKPKEAPSKTAAA